MSFVMTLSPEDRVRLMQCMVIARNSLRNMIKDYERSNNDLAQTYGIEFIFKKIKQARDLERFTEVYLDLISDNEPV